MLRVLSTLLILSLLLIASSSLAQSPFSSLEERMTFEEFRNSGLEKLSIEELTELNNWIRSHSLGAEEGVIMTASLQQQQQFPSGFNPERIGFQDYRGEAVPIESRIKGRFVGWNDDTKFELENGMTWRQVQNGILGVRPRENPEVVIEPGLFGSWYLTLDGINKRIQVKRIK